VFRASAVWAVMPLRHGASRSRSEAGGETPRLSMASLMASERQVRMTIGLGGQSEQKASTNEEGRESLISDAAAPCWWALLDSGMLSTAMFFIAMLMYLAAIPPYNCVIDEATYNYYYRYYASSNSCVPSYHWSSWLFLIAALLFVIESAMDAIWGLKRIFVQRSLQRAQKELGITATGRPSASTLRSGRPSGGESEDDIRYTAFDNVPWDLFAALLFMTGSIFYLVASLIDKNAVNPPWTWLIIGYEGRQSIWPYSELCSKIAASIFVVNSIVGLVGRYSYIRTTPVKDQLVKVFLWTANGFFDIDWALWGDMFFFIGAVVGAYQQFATYSEPLDWLVESLWTLDALFYMIACWPTMRSMMKAGECAA